MRSVATQSGSGAGASTRPKPSTAPPTGSGSSSSRTAPSSARVSYRSCRVLVVTAVMHRMSCIVPGRSDVQSTRGPGGPGQRGVHGLPGPGCARGRVPGAEAVLSPFALHLQRQVSTAPHSSSAVPVSKSKTRVWCCDSNESPDFANLQLFVATQLGTMQQENANAVLLPSCPSAGWATLEPLTPRPGYQWDPVRFDVLPSFRHLCARSHGFVVRAGRVSHG